MTLALVFPVLPPAIDGIGAYTARLAEALATTAEVSIYTAAKTATIAPSVRVVPDAFSVDAPSGIRRLRSEIHRMPPDWLVVQYNPFSYGRWGYNPNLPHLLYRLRRECPTLRIAVMVHEPFVPVDRWQWALMTTWQRAQLWALGRTADTVFFSTAPWSQRFRSWFPNTLVSHLPVGSNIPRTHVDRSASRSALGYEPDDLVVGIFGSGHFSRLLDFAHAGIDALQSARSNARVLYVGPAGPKVRAALPTVPVHDAGALPDSEVSRHFAAMDLYLAPFRKGASTRRGSLLVGLQHGIPSVSTYGAHTDDLFYREAETSLLMAPDDRPDVYAQQVMRLGRDPALRAKIGLGGRRLFDSTFTWSSIAGRMMKTLSTIGTEPKASTPSSGQPLPA